MRNKQLEQYLRKNTNPHNIVCKIEETNIPYNRQETYHTAHNMNKLRPIDYHFLSKYSRDTTIQQHAQQVLKHQEQGKTLGR